MMRPETFRKTLVTVAMGLCSFTEAYIMGHTACIVAGLYQEKEELQITEDDISWIMSLVFSSMMFGTLLGTLLTEKIGRRITVAVFMIPVVIHWFMLYYGRNVYVLMSARFLAGIGFGGSLPMIYMATAECSSTKMRGFNLAIITAVMPSIGATAGSNIGIVIHWRTAALIGAAPSILSAIIPLFCVESPSWLASKGRFDECEAAFTSLHGHKPSAQKELQLMLEVEKAKFSTSDKTTHTIKIVLIRLKVAAKKWYFWKIMFLTNIMNIYKLISGRILYGSYGIIILKKITGQPDILPYTLAISLIGVAGSGVTIFLLKNINFRTLLFPGGILNCLLVIGLSISLYVAPDSYDSSLLVWTNVMLYVVHISLATLLLFPILESLPAELFPLEIRGACTTIVAFIGTGLIFVVLKITPAMFALVDIYGVFFINAVAMLVFLLYLWMKMPETRGKSLHEIELNLKNEEFLKENVMVSGEQMKELI